MELEASRTVSLKGTDVPTLKQLNAHVRPLIADVWYDLGLQLFDSEDKSRLDTIKANKPSDADGACTEMFSLWIQKYPSASWNSLISTIKGPGVEKHNVAHKVEQIFQLAVPVAMDTSTSPVEATSTSCYADLFKSTSICDAYTKFTSELYFLLKDSDPLALKLALARQAKAPGGIELKKSLNKAVDNATTSYDLLRALEKTPDCNWLNTRLLKAVVNGSRLLEAKNLIAAYEEFLLSKKLSEVLSQFSKSKIKESYITEVCAKIDVSRDVTVGDLFAHYNYLEHAILNLGKKRLQIKDIRKGCLEFSSSTAQCSFSTYKNALQNFQKFCRVRLMSLKVSGHPVIYDPWLFDLDEQNVKRKEVFYEHEVATQLCNILLDNTPVDDIITVFSSHDLLMGDDVTVVTNAPSDHLKKMFLLRLFQSISLSVWSVICDVVSRSETLKHLSDQLNEQKPSTQPQLQHVSADATTDEQPLVTYSLCGTKMISKDDSVTATVLHSFPKLSQRRSSTFCQLHYLRHLRPSTVERVFQYTVRHVTELLSCCDPELLIKWCENLMANDTHQIKLFTANFINQIRQIKSSPAILKMLNHYWTWSNYSILRVVAQFSKLALDLLEEFGTRLNTMLPITEYPIRSLAVSMFPYDSSSYTVLTLECDHKLNHSLQLVYDMQSLITENCDISQHALLLLAVDSGSTRLHWMIPKSVVTIVNSRVMQCSQILFSKGVVRIFIYPSTVHVLDCGKTVWPYMFLNKSEMEDSIKIPRPPGDQLQMLQHIRKQRDKWYARAKQSEEAEEKFRTGYEREEQKYKELKEQKTKESETVVNFKEKFASCKESLELTIKTLTGDTESLPTVAGPTKGIMHMESVQQLEHDLESLEQLTKHLLHKSVEHREEQSKSLKQLEQKLLQKEEEIEDMKSEMLAKDSKLDDLKKKEKDLFKMSSDLKLQNNQLDMRFRECDNELTECQIYLKEKDNDLSAAHARNEEMKNQISQLEELLVKEREEKENQQESTRAEAYHRLLQEKEQLNHQLQDARMERDKLLEQLSEAYSENQKNEGQLKMLSQNLNVLQSQEEDYKKEKDSMLMHIEQLDANLKASNKNLNEAIREYQITIQDLETTVHRKMALEGELTKLRGHYAQVNDERNQLKRIVDEKDKEIEELIDSKNKSIKEKDQEINHLQEQLTKYGGNMPRPDFSGLHSGPPTPPPPPPGWRCTYCSMINKPNHLRCYLCSSNRPADYKPPPGYQPTEEERKRLQDDELRKYIFTDILSRSSATNVQPPLVAQDHRSKPMDSFDIPDPRPPRDDYQQKLPVYPMHAQAEIQLPPAMMQQNNPPRDTTGSVQVFSSLPTQKMQANVQAPPVAFKPIHIDSWPDRSRGWNCPVCTFYNLPYYPGCKMCSSAPPEGYEPPADYVPTAEEMKFIQ